MATALPDPYTGMTQSDIALVKSTWLELERTARPLGVVILLQLFDSHPHYKQKFSRFQDSSTEQLLKDKTFEAHACYIMHTLGALVHNLDDNPTLRLLCKDIGEQHAKLDVDGKAFWDLKDAIMHVLGLTAGKQMPSGAGVAWNQALSIIFEEVTSYMSAKVQIGKEAK